MLQVIFAVALGVALFISSYASIGGVEGSIRRAARAAAGNSEWIVSGSGSGGVPQSLVDTLRQTPRVIAAPLVKASVTLLSNNPVKLQVWGVDTRSDAMVRLFGAQYLPPTETMVRMALVPNSILLAEGFANAHGLKAGGVMHVATRSGGTDLLVAGLLPDSTITRALGGRLGFMDIAAAESLFGQPSRVDSIQVAGIGEANLKALAKGYEVRAVGSLSPEAHDALLRVQSLYGLSLVAMLIGSFVVFSSVQVTVLERMKELATLRALGASRGQLLSAMLLEWVLVGLVGSVAGVFLGVGLSSVIMHTVLGAVNSMLPLVSGARVELTWPGFLMGIVVGLFTVVLAAIIPAIAAVRESPLLALRPHTYRLRNRQSTAFWIGLVILFSGLVLSGSGTFLWTLTAIALSFLGLALLMPQVMLFFAGIARGTVSKLFGFPGFLATDNLRKAPQRTAFNVIALGGALAIVVATATVVEGFTKSTHNWIHASLPFDLSVTSSDISAGMYSDETLPRSLLGRIAQVPGVAFTYGVRKSFTPFHGHDVMIIGVQTDAYIEAHRRHHSLGWAGEMANPESMRELKAGRGVFASENFLALNGMRVGDTIELSTPSGPHRVRILAGIEDYSWQGGLITTDLEVMSNLWKSNRLTYVDLQVSDPSQLEAVRSRVSELTKNEYTAEIVDRDQITRIADDVLRQSTSAADIQVWLATIIGFLGIGNSLVIGVLQRRREIGLLRAVGMPRGQLQRTIAIEALLIGVSAGILGMFGGLLGGWLPLRHFTFVITGYLFPPVVPGLPMVEVFFAATVIAVIAALLPIRRVTQIPVLTSIAIE